MKLQYLGTAASEGIPSPFCDCALCRRARRKGHKEVRTRSQAVVDDLLLIDFPADTLWHAIAYKVDLTRVRNCLVTHVHSDHLYPAEIGNLGRGFAHPSPGTPPFCFWGSEDTEKALAEELTGMESRAAFRRLTPFQPTEIKGYTVTALKAAHGTPHPYIYLITRRDQALLWAHDTDLFPEETWAYLAALKGRLSFVSLDCTEGAGPIRYDGAHMDLARCVACRDRLIAEGPADKGTRFCLSHFSHNGSRAAWAEFSKIAKKQGFSTAFDGMTVKF